MRKGQSIVEFAIIFPLLIIMLLVLFDLGRAVLYYSVLENAVREGTRYAMVQPGGGSDANIREQIQKYIYGMGDLGSDQINIQRLTDSKGKKAIKISINYGFQPILSGVMSAIGFSSLTIHANSQMYLSPVAQ
jgi:Flp pilus assembly protein TadG